MTSQVVDHRVRPLRLWPLNRAPTTGPVAPSIHSARSVSGLHSPIRVTSVTIDHTRPASARTTTLTSLVTLPIAVLSVIEKTLFEGHPCLRHPPVQVGSLPGPHGRIGMPGGVQRLVPAQVDQPGEERQPES